MKNFFRLPVPLVGLTALLSFAPSCRAAPPQVQAARANDVNFSRDIRPILADTCFACHGPDAATRKAKLRLDQRDIAVKLGAIVPGKADESELVKRIFSEDPDERMPPAKSKKKLTAQQRELLKRWVNAGAEYTGHWAFIAPMRPMPPAVINERWIRNPIDRFVLAKLEQQGLQPSAQADRRTLARRLSFDLVGLPPDPDCVEKFVNDRAPDAYERFVDTLLQSPHYGERMAMQWLDGARYADSNGYQADFERYMWRWRDWVIEAFNKNMPFDRFTIEQLAGDLLPNATLEQKIATGFNRNHRINTEGGTIAEEWLVENVVDRVDTTSQVWMGLTMGCARCHDHKYDPFTQKEFYQLFAFFNNVPEAGNGEERPVNQVPFMKAPRPYEIRRLQGLDMAVADAQARVLEKEKLLPALQAAWERAYVPKLAKARDPWVMLHPCEVQSAGGAKLTRLPDGSYLASGKKPARDVYTIVAPAPLNRITGVLLDVLPHERLAAKSFGRAGNGNVVLSGFEAELRTAKAGSPPTTIPIKFIQAKADYSQDGWTIEQVLDGNPNKGWGLNGHDPARRVPRSALFIPDKPIEIPAGAMLALRLRSEALDQHVIGRFRLSVTDAVVPKLRDQSGLPEEVARGLTVEPAKRTSQQRAEIAAYFRGHFAGEVTAADKKLATARQARKEYEAAIPTVMVMQEMSKPRDSFLLNRGQYNKKGPKVSMALPAALPALPEGAPLNRLGLARWLVDPAHPLTARVAVNRMWEKFFGTGIVKSSENFGMQGEFPSHPELLDWLATEFIRLGWDMKALQKTIVMSNTYRQSSVVTPALFERDPENRLLARGPRFRLQAELIRDNALSVAGLLVPRIGGPSVRPYQPDGVWDEVNVYGNLRNYKHDTDDGLYRRSMYTIWKRTSAPPQMLLFDSPSREYCTVRRSRTNTPLQALTLLNEITFVEAARVLAQHMLEEGGKTPEARIAYAFRHAMAREPSVEEARVLAAGVAKRLQKYCANPEAAAKLVGVGQAKRSQQLDVAELAAYTITASVILNLDETVTKE
ncbi:MAG TPA: PSD1 and planctomycete cytochrome C domain-containing protein [Gemmataceae bacterium]|nr:PSD1 and planctomycete cytochrome C domain-containing protein [Gemmataceae bacterium]